MSVGTSHVKLSISLQSFDGLGWSFAITHRGAQPHECVAILRTTNEI
jgi:hypothetical protein